MKEVAKELRAKEIFTNQGGKSWALIIGDILGNPFCLGETS